MTRLRIASLFLAVVAGDYAALRLIYGQLADFGVSAAVCAGSLVTAGLFALADNRCRQAVARGRAAVWLRRDKQATAGADQQCPLCGGARRSGSAVISRPRPASTSSARRAGVRANNQASQPDSLTGRAASPAWKCRHERTRHRVGFTEPLSKSAQGTKSSTVPVPRGRRR